MKKYGKIVFIGFIAVLFGCKSSNMENSSDLEVTEQIDSIHGGHEENDYCWASFNVDVPVNGPQLLVDSVMVLVNREVYKMCEYCIEYNDCPDEYVAYSEKEMFTNDGKRLLSHYMEKYKPLIEDSLWNTFGLELKMEAQTEKYVTYGMERFYCGASCSSEKHFFTFDKSDGHQVKEIVSRDNLVQFFEDYPEYNIFGIDPWSDEQGWKFSADYDFINSYNGLLEDCFTLVINGVGNHYFHKDVPYSQIFSYLSPEAQALVEQTNGEELMLPTYLPERSEDGEVWMEVDTINHALLGYIRAAGGPHISTLTYYEPELEVYPKRVHSIDADGGSTVFLFIYSRGHLLYCDEAMTCIYDDENSLRPVKLFSLEGERDSLISCMWYDQLVEASNGFPYEEVDENRFGIHYDWFTMRLYVPIMDSHDPGSEFANTSCLQYTGRFEVLQFNGKEFVLTDNDGAWWLNKDLRDYKRTVSNKKNADGIEQIDLMPDGTYRRTFWKGAKTLDDLRKKPDEVKISKQNDFNKK